MIAINNRRGKEEERPAAMRTHDLSNRMTRVRFETSENTRFCPLSSQHFAPREPLEIISEVRHIRSNITQDSHRHLDHDERAGCNLDYCRSQHRAKGRTDGLPFRRFYPSPRAWHPKAPGSHVHRTRPSNVRDEERKWSAHKATFAMKPVTSANYWGWSDQRSKRNIHTTAPNSTSTPNLSIQAVAVTVSNDDSPASQLTCSVPPELEKRETTRSSLPSFKRQKGLDRLDILVRASLEMGPMQENPTGCSCPKSKCVALYCECFKSGRRCDPKTCTCIDCKNTLDESGPNGARTVAIRSILARNPRAFLTAGTNHQLAQQKLAPGDVACNCIRSRCLKLYCICFQQKKTCKEGICSCVGCLNTEEDTSGDRKHAIQSTLEKRPDAFETRTKEVGLGCACKNNRCIRKYCECFRNSLACTSRCSCNNCENKKNEAAVEQPASIDVPVAKTADV